MSIVPVSCSDCRTEFAVTCHWLALWSTDFSSATSASMSNNIKEHIAEKEAVSKHVIDSLTY